jgi:hypothetical protein
VKVEHILSYFHWYMPCSQDVILLPLLNIVTTEYCKDFFTAWYSLLVSCRHLIFEDLYLYHIQPIQHLEFRYIVLRQRTQWKGIVLGKHWSTLTLSFRSHYGPGVDSASNRNEYQVYFLGVKAAGL